MTSEDVIKSAAKRRTDSAACKSAPPKKLRASTQGNNSDSFDATPTSDVKNDEPMVTKIIIKGKVPVDPQCVSKVGLTHVLQEDGVVYSFMLNQTNLQHNNNKYFLGQVLENDEGGGYCVWFRWGRVGKTAQTSLQPCSSKTHAISIFTSKFKAKTRNSWLDRKNFTKIDGYYDLIEQDFGEVENTEEEKEEEGKLKEEVSSLLPPQVLAVMLLISDVRTMEHQMREMNYDARRAPLGKLTMEQIRSGYEALKCVSTCIEKLENHTTSSLTNKKRKTKAKRAVSDGEEEEDVLRERLLLACNTYYTRIPHDFGMKVPPLISTPEMLRSELDLLKALEDIEAAFSIIKKEGKTVDMHPADKNYANLKCEIKPIASGDRMDEIIRNYIRMSHGQTHSSWKLEVLATFELEKDGEAEAFQDYGNRRLLWHGSRLTNWMGILGRGLKIAPPEAPHSGYMFGKGVYFADCASKSVGYITTSSDDIGFMALCEVSLGEVNPLIHGDYHADKLPEGKHSVQGVGSSTPDPSTWITLDDGTVVPCGKMIDSKVAGCSLYYNEFIVYDVRQIRLRYLVQLKRTYEH